MDSSSDDDSFDRPLPVIPYRMVGGGPLLQYSPARRGRSWSYRAKYSYPNRLVLEVAEEWRQLTLDFRRVLEEREEMEATMEAQAARFQELENRKLEEHQRADASHAQFQKIERRLIRVVQEAGNHVDGIMAERLEEALLRDVPGEAAPAVEIEVELIEEDPEKDPPEAVGSSSSVHLY